jgi:HAD superfamily hydrolase (TIGR01484 family)
MYVETPLIKPDSKLHTELPHFWKQSVMGTMVDNQKKRGWEPTAIRSDHDNSFFRPDHLGDTIKLETVAAKHDIPIIVVTGNDAQSLIARNKEQNLLPPQVVIGAVGTEIWVLKNGSDGTQTYELDKTYDKKLKDMHFDRKTIVTDGKNAIDEWKNDPTKQQWQLDFQHPDTEAAFLKEAKPQDIQPYKVSYYVFAHGSERPILEQQLKTQFPNLHLSLCEEVVYNKTITPNQQKKFCVDVLPIEPKADAIDYVTKLLDIKHGLTVGDSGNDIPLLMRTDPSRGESVLVGGSKPELIEQTLHNARELLKNFSKGKITEGWYRLPDGRKVFSRQDQDHVAAGSIIEAVKSRLTMTKRFVTDNNIRQEISTILEELTA